MCREPPEVIRIGALATLGHIKVLAALTLCPRASQVSCNPPQVSSLTFAHPLLTQPRSPTHRRPLDQSSHPTRVHFGPLASAAKMGSHDGVVPWLHCTRRQVGSNYNSELGSPTFRVSSSFSSTSLAVCRRPQSFILLSSSSTSFSSLDRMLHFHRSLALVLYP